MEAENIINLQAIMRILRSCEYLKIVRVIHMSINKEDSMISTSHFETLSRT